MGGLHLATGRPVRLWVAPGDTTAMMRLKRLLPAVVALDHPALIPVLDAGLDERGLYLVEARIEGEPLTALIGEPQAPDRVADIVRQLARVLADAHGRGIVHGALSPAAVVLQQTLGRSDYVRLRGLGLGETPFAGDPGRWAAPEAVTGRAADARGDLYALGLIGRALLGGLGPDEAAAGPLPGAPPGLVEVLDALVRRSPGQRPPSAVAVLGPLERATTAGSFTGGMRPVAPRAMADTMVSTASLPEIEAIGPVNVPVEPLQQVMAAGDEVGRGRGPRRSRRAMAGARGRRGAGRRSIPTRRSIGRRRRGARWWVVVVAALLAVIGWLLLRGSGEAVAVDAGGGRGAGGDRAAAGADATPIPDAGVDAAPDSPDAAPIAPPPTVIERPAADSLRPAPAPCAPRPKRVRRPTRSAAAASPSITRSSDARRAAAEADNRRRSPTPPRSRGAPGCSARLREL
ncbi:MAG: hypothetical protein H6703_11380 [Myxococcales bacterium]|nr:hypothetical protein [Myxococcales bacterium]